MKKYWKTAVLVLGAVVAFGVIVMQARNVITLATLKNNSEHLVRYVDNHYTLSVLVFAAAIVSTALCVPGALVLTVSGGFFFGPVLGSLYASAFSTAGSVIAFLLSRHYIGGWIQRRYRTRLRRFNHEISLHGLNYLFILRIVPVMPAFVVNYLSGLTRISTGRFALISFLGFYPGAFVYSFAGRELRKIESTADLLSGNIVAGLGMLALLAFLPVLFDLLSKKKKGKMKQPDGD